MSDSIRVIGPEDWTSMPWRNGGGITSEIVAERRNGALLWRLSTAVVDADGPYSDFPGLTRISTVIAGKGTEIRDMPDGEWRPVAPLSPTLIEGSCRIQGRLTDGPIRYLNLFFDPTRLSAQVSICRLDGSAAWANERCMIFCVEGHCEMAPSPGAKVGRMDCAINLPTAANLLGSATLVTITLRETP